MDSGELIQFLKDNLAVEIDTWGGHCESGYVVRLKLGSEVISESKITTESSE